VTLTTNPVQGTGMTFSGTPPPNPVPTIAQGLIETWMNANLSQFNYVFATINVASKIDTGQFTCLNPTTVGYAFAPSAPGGDGTFAVLAMTGGDSATGLPYSVSPNAIPAGAPSGFLVSSRQFLTYMLLPSLPVAFPKAPPNTFALISDSVIQNNQSFDIDFQVGSKTYTASVAANSCSYTITGTELTIVMTGMSVLYSPGIHINIDFKDTTTVTLYQKPDGTSVLIFQGSNQSINHTVTQEDWVTGVTVTASIVASIIAGSLGFYGSFEKLTAAGLSQATAKALAALIAVFAGAAAAAFANIATYIGLIADGEFNKLPSLDPVIANAFGQVQWPTSSGFKLLSSGLAGSWQLGIDPGF
jgi:hypothetical protein